MGLKNKRKHFYFNILQHFDDIFKLHPSLDIENASFRNLRIEQTGIEGSKNTGSFINLTTSKRGF